MTQVELIIQNKLLEGKDIGAVGEELLAELNSMNFNFEQHQKALYFLLHSGQYRKAFLLIRKWIGDKRKVPWAAFLQICHDNTIPPCEEVLNAIFEGAQEQHLESDLVRARCWDEFDSRFADLRAQKSNQRQVEYQQRVLGLKEKLNFLQAQRMLEEEEKLLQQLEKAFPDDDHIKNKRQEFRVRWAREILSKAQAERTDKKIEAATYETLSQDESNVLEILLEAAREQVAENPDKAYLFSIAFFQMDAFNCAYEILKDIPNSFHTDWLRLEVLLASRRYIECLDEVNRVEIRHADHAETLFASTYMRALALIGLGQISTAVALLKSILNVRPSYRSTAALISEWTES